MKEEFNSLDEKLLELKKKVCIMQKNADGYGYKYVTEDSILLVINDIMIELGISLTPRFKDKTLYSEVINYKDAKGKDKTDVLVRSEMQFVWKDIKTKEEIVIDWALLGQQSDASQALGSGLTYANRYFLLKYFLLNISIALALFSTITLAPQSLINSSHVSSPRAMTG